MNVGVVGLGVISPIHLAAIENNPDTNLVAVCDIDESKLEKFSDISTYTDLDTMLDEVELDAIHICTPHFLHHEMIQKAADKGVNVMCEKPLDLNYKSAVELEKNIDLDKVKVAVCLQNRLNDTTLKMEEIVKSKMYGKLLAITANVYWNRDKSYYENSDWRGRFETEGGGVLINQSIHTIDLVDHLTGSNLVSIFGNVNLFKLQDCIEVEDSANFIATYENGVEVNVNVTNTFLGNQPVEIKLVFEDATVQLMDNKLLLFKDDEVSTILSEVKSTLYKSYFGPSHEKTINQFYQSIKEDSNDYIKFTEGISVLRVIDNLRKSNKEEKRIYIGENNE